jgi:hypothetical protein
MIARCEDPGVNSYEHYGGAGVKVCTRWRSDFSAFLEDMKKKPSPGYSIDRIDNDGDYTPENCRWASKQQQANNRRTNRRLTHKGVTKTIAEWARERRISPITLVDRINRGWSISRALTESISSRPPRLLTFHGKTQSMAAWADELGIKPVTLRGRIYAGWSVERALTTEVKDRKNR